MSKIWANTIVQNEERYLWFAVMSVINFVDKVLIWDTGSSDNTSKVVEELIKVNKSKIDFREIGPVDPVAYTSVRQRMLEETKNDWFLIVDGDEVWWDKSIKKLVDLVNKQGDKLDSIVTPYYNIVGDIYHYQEKEAGKYRIDDKKGHINIRAVNRKIPGIHFEKPHGQLGLYDLNHLLIQDRPQAERVFLDAPYMHFTNMIRSSSRKLDEKVPKRSFKLKYEIGKEFPNDFLFPEVFYREYPSFIKSPFQKMSKSFYLKSAILSIPRKVKRRLLKSKSGY
ncbi:glycosyltransferase family 2 protein [Candidatus Daviesbacteria bacterium]|nr:glycosyltransferase family 2 protein [Candidatus Daviesbacteria bacterium]